MVFLPECSLPITQGGHEFIASKGRTEVSQVLLHSGTQPIAIFGVSLLRMLRLALVSNDSEAQSLGYANLASKPIAK